MAITTPSAAPSVPVRLLLIAGAGAAVSVLAGVYGEVHDPTGEQPNTLFVVEEGRGRMPAFGGILAPEEIRQVVDYTRTL